MLTQSYLENLSYRGIGCVLEVHKHLGPGLLESNYYVCLIEHLKFQKNKTEDKPYVPIIYKNNFLCGKLNRIGNYRNVQLLKQLKKTRK